MSTSARKRLIRDYRKLQNDPNPGVTAAPFENDILQWEAVIFGPSDTPFEEGTFKLTLKFTEEYPNKPPEVKFVSKMFHPNIYKNGQICLDILSNNWSSSYDVLGILISIQSLLDEPNIDSPANQEASELFENDRQRYNIKVRESVELSWESV